MSAMAGRSVAGATTRRGRAVAHTLRAGARRAWFIEPEIAGLDAYVPVGGTCLDVGAEYGLYAWTLADLVGPDGQVHAVEPQPGLARFLRGCAAAMGARNVTVHQMALSDAPGTGEITLPWRGLLPVHGRAFLADRAAGLGSNREFRRHRSMPVTTSTLDDLVGELGVTRLDFLKADVEGAESLLLAGARRTVQTLRPTLMLELEDRHLARFDATVAGIVADLAELGYQPHCWSGDRWQPYRPESVQRNVLFVP